MSLYRLLLSETDKLNREHWFAPLGIYVLYAVYFYYLLFADSDSLLVKAIVNKPDSNFAFVLMLSDWTNIFLVLMCFIIAATTVHQEKVAGDYLNWRMTGRKVYTILFAKYLILLFVHFVYCLLLFAFYFIYFIAFSFVNNLDNSAFIETRIILQGMYYFLSLICVASASFALSLLINDLFKSLLVGLTIMIFSITMNYLGIGWLSPFSLPAYFFSMKRFFSEETVFNHELLILHFGGVLLFVFLSLFLVQKRLEKDI